MSTGWEDSVNTPQRTADPVRCEVRAVPQEAEPGDCSQVGDICILGTGEARAEDFEFKISLRKRGTEGRSEQTIGLQQQLMPY